MFLPSLYSRRSDGKVQIWRKEVVNNKHRTHSGIHNGEIVVAEFTAAIPKNVGKKNEVNANDQAMIEAKAEWKKKKDKGYHEKIEDIDNVGFFEPMLAKVWGDYKEETEYPAFIQPKLDGLRLIARKDGLWSRNGKPYVAIPHIAEALKPLFKQDPYLIFDGEIYADKFANDFNKICSLAKQSKPTEEDLIRSAESIEYHIYDFPMEDKKFSIRHEHLQETLSYCNDDRIKLVETQVVKSEKEINNYYEHFIEAGYEGAIVRWDKAYENKRTKSLLKYKEFQDTEFLIVDVLEGLGNKSGMAGAFVCRNKDGSHFNSNIKGNRKLFRDMLNNKKRYIGQMATIQFFNLTPDGVPRFPYFIRLRGDE